MALQTFQEIYAGAAQLLIGTSPTKQTTETTTNINNAATAYTALTTELVVDDASAIAPDVYETSSTLTLGDPPVIDSIACVATGEIMWCWKRTDSSETIFVIRGCGMYVTNYSYSNTQYSSATSVADNAELQLMGTFTMPTRASNLIVTNGDVTFSVAQGSFKTRDNYTGYENSFTDSPAESTLTATFPRNTLPETLRTLGHQSLTDGNSPTLYFAEPGRAPASTKLPNRLIVVVPNDVLGELPTVTIGANNHLDITKCIIIPKAQIMLNMDLAYSEGSQREINPTFDLAFEYVMQKTSQLGAVKDQMRIMEVIS